MLSIRKNRCELMKSIDITVIDGLDGDNLWLYRDDIYIPFNVINFMLFDETRLVIDVNIKFREKLKDISNNLKIGEDWKKEKYESNLQQMEQYLEDIKPKQYHKNNIILKKKIIRDKLIEKGLFSF